MNKQYIAEVIRLFVVKEKQGRFLEFIESPKRYDDFLWELLNDPRNIKPECVTEVPSGEADNETTIAKLRKMGAGREAYMISLNSEADGRSGTLEDLFPLIVNNGEIIYCVGHGLAYYEGHENWRYILRSG